MLARTVPAKGEAGSRGDAVSVAVGERANAGLLGEESSEAVPCAFCRSRDSLGSEPIR